MPVTDATALLGNRSDTVVNRLQDQAWCAAQGKIEQGYGLLFMFCGCAYLVAWTLMRLLVPPK